MKSGDQSLLEILKDYLTTETLELTVFPSVALELQGVLAGGDFKIDQVAGVILKDQAYSSQVLKLANSCFFAGLKKVTTIREAIIRLGAEQILNCLIMVGQKNLYCSKNRTMNDYLQGLWKHSLACALGTQWFAGKIGYSDLTQEALLAGLLHDIGKLFLLTVIEKIHLSGNDGIDCSEALLQEVIATMHSEHGYNLLRHWNVPDIYCDIARDHHKEEFDEDNALLLMVRIVNQACSKIGLGMNHEPSIVLAALPEVHVLGVKEVTLAELEVALEDAAVVEV